MEAELFIQQIGPKGDGICQSAKGRVFVERSAPGDRIRARVRRDEVGIQRAEIVRILDRSPERIDPPCPHYVECGGCTLQHLSASFYRRWKVDTVREALSKQRLIPKQWLNPVFVEPGNRRRLNFSAQRRRGILKLGYYRRRSQEIVDIASCLIADPELFSIRAPLKILLSSILREGTTLDIFLQKAGNSIEAVLTGPVGRHGAVDRDVEEDCRRFLKASRVNRISWRKDGEQLPRMITGQGDMVAKMGELDVQLPPAAFLQASAPGEEALVRAVMEALPSHGKFADLFSGCGTFSGRMLSRGTVDAYESVPSAVSALSKSGAKNLRVFRRDLFRNPLRRDEINRYDAVVFDPPRVGCIEQVESMASARCKRLIGISCNPLTFARDAAALSKGGYRLQSVQVIDQFVWSHHVEIVGVFTK